MESWLRKPVRHTERALESRNTESRWQADEREVGFGRTDAHILIRGEWRLRRRWVVGSA